MAAHLCRLIALAVSLAAVSAAPPPAVSAALPPAVAAGPSFEREAPPEVAVTRARSGHPLVRPLINGRDVGWFILDTGSSQHIIAPSAAAAAGLKAGRSRSNRNLSGTVLARTRFGETLRLGPATFSTPAFTEIDLAAFSARIGCNLAGILGYELFHGTVAVLDYASGALSLHDPAEYDPPAEVTWHSLESSRHRPRIAARFEGHAEIFLIDTGDPGSVTVYSPAVARLDLLKNRRTRRVSSLGIHGSADYREGRLQWLELAGRRFDRPRAHFSLMQTGAHAVTDPAGHIGCRLLEPFLVVFDYGGVRVGLIPRS